MSDSPFFPAPEPPPELQRQMAELTHSIRDMYLKHTTQLVEEMVKDLNGGLPMNPGLMRQHVGRELRPDGCLFYFRNRPALFVSHPNIRREGGKLNMDVKHKFLYREELIVPAAN